ncbi:MAG: HEAT repeat domain-containing protein [Chrysiogenetes bacterium]|nr:HEAT repeat domain-containing protein [Chrysiogenetes bacterium]
MSSEGKSWTDRLAALSEEERIQTLQGLQERPAEGTEAFLAALADPNWRVRKAGTEGVLLLEPTPELLDTLIGFVGAPDNAGLRNAAMESLVAFGDVSVEPVLTALENPDGDVRLFCCNILGQIGDPRVLPALIAALADPVENVRTGAVENLGRFRGPHAAEALIRCLESDELALRFAALEALASQAALIPLPTLERLLSQSILRKAVFDVMSSGEYPGGVALMVEGLKDSTRSSREAALRALWATVVKKGDAVRPRIVELLRTELDDAQLDTLAESLSSHDQDVRCAVVAIIGAASRPGTVDPLLKLINDEGVYRPLRESLAFMQPNALEDWLSRFDKLEANAQAVAALAFGKAHFTPALPLLHRSLRSDNGRLLRSAAEAVGDLGDAQSVPDLAGLLQHAYPDVREAAEIALESIGTDHPELVVDAIQAGLASTDPGLRAASVRVLGQVAGDESVIERLLLALGDVDAQVRAAAAQALAAAHLAEAGQGLARAIADENPGVRRTVAFALGRYDGEETLKALKAALKDPDLWVRSEAARSLGRIGTDAALDILERAFSDPQLHPVLAARALEALEEVSAQRASDRALELLDHSDPDILISALTVLGRTMKDHESLVGGVLARLAKHEHWNVRSHAASLLGKIGTEKARDLLARLLDEERDGLVQKALTSALLGSTDS